jgi:hypothetical protein
MNVRKKIWGFLILLAVICLAAAIRLVQIIPYPLGGGAYKASPDKRYTAWADTLTDQHFLGGEVQYYEFRIRQGDSPMGTIVRKVTIDKPGEGFISWRTDGQIVWAADSSTVTFNFGRTRLTLELPK